MWQNYNISEKDIELFRDLIPEYCIEPLKQGSMQGLAVVNRDSTINPLVGIVLYSFTRGYVEVEWVATDKAYPLPEHGADIVRMLVNKARLSRRFKGVFATFREGDMMDGFFPEYEFTRMEETDRIYRFRLSDVEKIGEETHKDRLKNCVALGKAADELKESMIKTAEDEGQILPLEYPVNWDSYVQEVSAIYKGSNGEAEGVVLIGEDGPELVLRLFYSTNPAATVALLEYAFTAAMVEYGEDKEVACPVLSKASEKLVKDVVKNPKSEKQVRAQVIFPMGTGMMRDFEMYA